MRIRLNIKPFLLIYLLANVTTPSIASPIGHAPWVGESLKGAPCLGENENFGPFDYLQRQSLQGQLNIVESYHFTPEVEQLIRGKTGDSPLGDLDYTLRAWPNHHRALYSVIQHRINTFKQNTHLRYPPAECYLQRAMRFSSKDTTVHMLYGILLQRTGRREQALKEYERACELDPNNVQAKYNLALLLVELKRYSEAKDYADKLYGRGFPLPGLRDKLKAAGQWN